MTDLEDRRMRRLVLADIQTPQAALKLNLWQRYKAYHRLCNEDPDTLTPAMRAETFWFAFLHVVAAVILFAPLFYWFGSMGVWK